MPHLSKKKIPAETYDFAKKELLTLLVKSGMSSKRILSELLTPTELLMLSKRLALISMLHSDYSYYRINQRLGISTSTIKRFHSALLTENHKAIEAFFKNKKKNEEFWDTLEVILRAGMPPIVGRRYTKKKPY